MTMTSHPNNFVIGEPIVMFYVGRYLGNDLSLVYPADVYAAVRGWWHVVDPAG